MVITATSFLYVTLCIFSSARLWIHQGSSVAIVCINTLCWASFHGSLMYGNIHMGHFARKEVNFDMSWHGSINQLISRL